MTEPVGIEETVDWQMTESPAAIVQKGEPGPFDRGRHWMSVYPAPGGDTDGD